MKTVYKLNVVIDYNRENFDEFEKINKYLPDLTREFKIYRNIIDAKKAIRKHLSHLIIPEYNETILSLAVKFKNSDGNLNKLFDIFDKYFVFLHIDFENRKIGDIFE